MSCDIILERTAKVRSRSGLGRWTRGPRSRGDRLARIEQGNLSNVKSVGQGVLEYRIDFGPGYRIYLGRDGETIVILLTGGTKKRQQRDIETATELWQAYKKEKRSRR